MTLEVERLDDTGAGLDGLHVLRAGGRAWADEPLALDPPVLIVDTTRVPPVPGTPSCRADLDGPAWEASYRITPNLLRTGRAWLVETTLAPTRARVPLGGPPPTEPAVTPPVVAAERGGARTPPPVAGGEPVGPSSPSAEATPPPGAPVVPRDPVPAAEAREPGAPRLAPRRRDAPDAAAADHSLAAASVRMQHALDELDALVAQLGGLESQVSELRSQLDA